MKFATLLLISAFVAVPALAAPKAKCGKRQTWHSCAGKENAQRPGFCSRTKELTEDVLATRCAKPKTSVSEKSKKSSKKLAKNKKRKNFGKKVASRKDGAAKKRKLKRQKKSTPPAEVIDQPLAEPDLENEA